MKKVSNKIAIYIISITVFILLSGCQASTQSDALSQLHDKGIININEDSFVKVVKNGDAESVKLLLELGIDANIEINNGRTPLMIAAERGDIEVVRLLVSNGAEIQKTSTYGYNAIILAAMNEHWDVADYLKNCLEQSLQ